MNCDCNSKNYADFQNAEYDSKNNKILYGINKNMNGLGVSNGTCNQNYPIIYEDGYKCGLGVAGGNPCNNSNNKIDYNIENFKNTDNKNNGMELTKIINIILILLLIYLLYTNCK